MRTRRMLVPALATLLLIGLAVVALVRGAWAGSSPPEPDGESPVAGVVRTPEGGKEVCAAVLLSYPMDEVWQVITDYDRYGDVCSFIRAAEVDKGPDGCKVAGRVDAPLAASLPFAMELKQEQDLFEYRSTWDQASGAVEVNRGGWVARPVGPRQTLLLIRLEVRVRGVPTVLLRNLSRHRLCEVLRAVRRRLDEGPLGKPW
jgi:hypothetical protein